MDVLNVRAVNSFYILSMEQRRVISIIVLVSISVIIPVGYHIIVLNVPEKILQQAIEVELLRDFGVQLGSTSLNLLWSFIVSCQSVGALFGCLSLIPFLSAFGVKNSLLIANNILLLLGSFILFFAYYVQTTVLLIFGRILIGVYTGLATGLLPIYVQELAPTQIKGAMSCFLHIAVLIGGAISSLLSLETFLGGNKSWHFLLAAPVVCVVFQTSFAKYLPHTPGYFLSKGQSIEAADSARYYYNLQCYEDTEAVQEYRKLVKKMPEQRSFRDAMRNRHARRAIGLGMLVSAAQILSGTMSVATYSSSMFSSISIMNGLVSLFPMMGSILSILVSLPALKLVETCGRRPLLINTLTMCAIANFLLCILSISVQYFDLSSSRFGIFISTAMTLSFLLLGVGYNLGVGPVAYFICAELVDVHYISVAMSCSIAINWIMNLITTLIYYPLNGAIGGFSYLLFAIPTALAVLILQKCLPETKYVSKMEASEVVLSCNAPYEETTSERYGTFNT